MGKLYNKMLVTAEKAGTFHAACDMAAFLSEKFPPETVDFLFINEELSGFGPELGQEVRLFQERTKSLGINVEQSFREGNFHRGTLEMANHFGAEIILCGADNITRRFWNGSQTYKLLREAKCPVISIQNPMRRKSIERILVPIDSSTETRQKIPTALKYAQLFGAEVHIVGLASSKSKEVVGTVNSYANQSIYFLNERGVDAQFEMMIGSNITDMTLHYADQIEADLIIIMAVEEPNPYGFFEGSFPEQMILKSATIPVLAIQQRDDLVVEWAGL